MLALTAADVRAVVLTPAHQSPTGVVLTDRRRQLLERARTTNALIIEDDYDAEFRYDRSPVGTVQGLAPDRVVLLGTVSKSLIPTGCAPPRPAAATAEPKIDLRPPPEVPPMSYPPGDYPFAEITLDPCRTATSSIC